MSAVIQPRPQAELLTYHLENTQPLELEAFSDSLRALSAHYARFAEQQGATLNDDAVRLYVRSIREGSIIVDLIAAAQHLKTVTDGVKTVVSFGKVLGHLIDFFRGKEPAPPAGTTSKDARDVHDILGPVARDRGASFHMEAHDGGSIQVVVNVNSSEANAIQNRARNWAAAREAKETDTWSQQLFYWYQARGVAGAKTGDKGIIEAISKRPVKTVFANEKAKAQMLGEALFKKAYVVDVRVQTIGGKPALYTVLDVHDSFDRE